MKISTLCRDAFGVLSASAILAACGGTQLPPQARNAAAPVRSWSEPQASSADLLYISDVGTNDVYLYSYPGGALMGTLTGFDAPGHLCSDRKGDVFVTNTNAQQIVEYEHGASKPKATLPDPHELPVDCAVDGVTGDLAVTNYGPSGSNLGNVAVYPGARGRPKLYADRQILAYLYCAYDRKGDLFVDGLTYKYDFALVELPKGKGKFERITLPQKFTGWGGVQWSGNRLAIGNGAATIYEFAIRGKVAKEVGSTSLGGAANVVQFWIGGGKIVGPDGPDGGNKDVGIWTYPAGGEPTQTIAGPFEDPSGATVSRASSP
jgi:hypothetical protein